MSIVILQLSDFHLSSSLKRSNPILENVPKLCGAAREVLHPDDDCFLLITGDLADRGKREEYELALRLLTSVAEEMEEYLHRYPKVIMVPGNHDLDFELDDKLRCMALNSLNYEDSLDPGVIRKCLEPQVGFRAFAVKLGELLEVEAATDLHHLKKYTSGKKSILFNLINTAAFSKLTEEKSKIAFPVTAVCQNLVAIDEPDCIVISVMHHPYTWFDESSSIALRRLMESQSDIVFTGHEHLPDSFLKVRDAAEQTLYLEGGVLQDHSNERASSFNVVRINEQDRSFQCCRYRWSDGLYLQVAQTDHKFLRLREPLRREFAECTDWQNNLEELGTTLLHPRVRTLRLSDIFVYPDFAQVDFGKGMTTRGTIHGRDVVATILEKRKVLISGAEKTGKTCLSKQMFRSLRDEGYLPILVSGNAGIPRGNKSPEERFRLFLKEQCLQTYEEPASKRFWQTKISERVIIIDDYHRLPAALRPHLLNWLDGNFHMVILLADSGFRIQELLEREDKASLLWDYEHLEILEYGRKARYEIIKKWVSLRRNTLEETEAQIEAEASSINERLGGLIEQNMVPSIPLVILMMLQQLGAKTAGHDSTGLYGHLYEGIIKDAVSVVSKDAADLETNLNYLTELAYHIAAVQKTKSLSRNGFAEWHKVYCEMFHLPLDQNRLLRLFSQIGVLIERGDSIRFKYRYYFNFFVARYMASKPHEADVEDYLSILCNSLHLADSANTLIFLCHLSREQVFIDRILDISAAQFQEQVEFDFATPPSLLPEGSFRASQLLLDDSPASSHREKLLEEADRHDRPNGFRQVSDEEGEVDRVTGLIAEVICAQNKISLCGHIARNHYGRMKGEQKSRLIGKVFALALRTLQQIFAVLGENREELAKAISEVLKQKHPLWPTDVLDEKTRRSLQFYCLNITFNWVKHASSAVGMQSLKISLDHVRDEQASLSWNLLDLSARLDFTDFLPETETRDMADRLARNAFGLEILRWLVWYYLYLTDSDDREVRQRISKQLGITYGPRLMNPSVKRT